MTLRTGMFPVVLLSMAISAPVHAQTYKNYVDDLIQQALDRNRDVLAARQRVNEAQGLLRQAGVRPSPTLEATGATGRPLATVGEEEYAVAYFHPIELGDKRDKRIGVAELSVQLASAELDEKARGLSFEIKSRAVDALQAKEKTKTLEHLSALNQEAYRITNARVEKGDAPPLDAQLLLVEQSRVEVQRASLSGKLDGGLVEIRQLVGLSSPDPLIIGEELPINRLPLNLSDLQDRAQRDRPDLRIGRLLDEQGESEVRLAEADSSPNVTLSARYINRTGQFDDQYGLLRDGSLTPLRDKDNVVMVGVSIPLFTASRNKGNVEAAAARSAAARLRRQHLLASVPLEVEAAYKRLVAAQTTVAIFDRGIIEQSEKNLEIIRRAYQLGELRLLDVLNEQRRLTDTQLSYVDAKADLARAVNDLEKVIGGNL